jgi:hypothetical protein
VALVATGWVRGGSCRQNGGRRRWHQFSIPKSDLAQAALEDFAYVEIALSQHLDCVVQRIGRRRLFVTMAGLDTAQARRERVGVDLSVALTREEE